MHPSIPFGHGQRQHTTSKEVEFSDGRVVVFEDKFQVVVMEPPTK